MADPTATKRLQAVFADEKGRIQAPTLQRTKQGTVKVFKLPTAAQTLRMSDAELIGIMQRFSVFRAWSDYFTGSSTYVAQQARQLTPLLGTPEFDRQMANLARPEDRRHLIGSVRRVQETWTTQRILDDNPNQEFIRVLDSHDNQCDACIARAGTIGSIEEHEAIGLPGASSCFGGDYCRCQLVSVG